jgi:hypothetical protein
LIMLFKKNVEKNQPYIHVHPGVITFLCRDLWLFPIGQ